MANLSKERREKMLRYLERLKKENSTEEDIQAINEIELALTEKKYGLVWEEHSEHVDEMLKDNIPVFSQDDSRTISLDSDAEYNFLLEGDNLHSLYLLEKTHNNRIDVIYIDPPYNTLKDGFSYDDKRVDSNDSFRHSKWISFLAKRLKIARNLLTDKGVIFISIDNSELYDLKLLCDSIFGERNFVGNIVWRTTTDNNVGQITTEHEYIVCYARDLSKLDKWTSTSPVVALFEEKYQELKKKFDDPSQIQAELRKWIKENKKDLEGFAHYDNVDEKGIFHDGDIANTVLGGYKYDVIHPVTNKVCRIPEKGFRFSEPTMREMLANGDIMFGKDEQTLIKPKIRIENNKSTLKGYYYEDNRVATKMLESIFNEKSVFSNPKSVNLLKNLISYASDKDAVILDFFAGSGSLGQAVLELNKSDGGNRTFILCTNNEISGRNTVRYLHSKGLLKDYDPGERTKDSAIYSKIDKTISKDAQEDLFQKHKSEYEEYGICRFVTYPRLKTVITGVREDESKYSDGLPANLFYYKTEFVSRYPQDISLTDLLLEHSPEMIQLQNMQSLYRLNDAIFDEDEIDEVIKDLNPVLDSTQPATFYLIWTS